MNRLILVGNGFDLAHGLKTSYKDFIDNYWNEKKERFKTLYNIETYYQREDEPDYEDDDIVINNITHYNGFVFDKNKESLDGYEGFSYSVANGQFRGEISFKNRFLEIITKKSSLQNWVDIEEEYYIQLKATINSIANNQENKYEVNDLNIDFSKVKNELGKYLINIHGQTITKNNRLFLKIYSPLHLEDFTIQMIPVIREEYKNMFKERREYDKIFDFLENHLNHPPLPPDYEGYLSNLNLRPKNMLFLNFNYTDIEKEYQLTTIGEQLNNHIFHKYLESSLWREMCKNRKIIHIHGELNNLQNPIIFGYGDEQDETHKEIEKLSGKYLDNVKTINYLKTTNYKELLRFMDSGYYQVFIMGHSCGISDKTLLNMLFEHSNCVSIKPFYYIDNNAHNNYDDIIKNLYRCFANKALMREKVVNLEYCHPLNKDE
jgi:hypothetical protein